MEFTLTRTKVYLQKQEANQEEEEEGAQTPQGGAGSPDVFVVP